MTDRPDDGISPPAPRRSIVGEVLGRLLRGAAPDASDAACFDGASQAGDSGSPMGEASAILRRVLPDIYFINTPESRSSRHLELLGRLSPGSNTPLIDFHQAPGLPMIECTLCAFDEPAPGLLAKLCGTMAALDLSIHTAFIYTLRLDTDAFHPEGAPISLAPASEVEAGRAVALNTFLMSESYFGHDRALTPKTQRRLSAEICRVLQGQASVTKLLLKSRHTSSPLHIAELEVENRAHESHTRILLRAGDSFGVLYRATSALAALGLDITAAQVSTREEAADDLFLVTQNGARLPDSSLASTKARLRAMLQGEA